MNLSKLMFATFLILSVPAFAAENVSDDLPNVQESAPNEPPFVDVNNEPLEVTPAPAPADSGSQSGYYDTAKKPVKSGTRVEKLKHPLQKKGLERIEKDGSYIYKTRKYEKTNKTATLRFGFVEAPKIKAADGTSFSTMYTSSSLFTLMFDYEWQPFEFLGKSGLQAGFGFYTAQGSGRFLNGGGEAREKYTFIAIPLNLGIIYRLEFSEKQWFVPYAAGGGTYMAMVENRDDSKSLHGVGSAGAYAAGGALFSITAIDRTMAHTLRSEYGLGGLWVSLEYRYLKSFSADLDFSSNIFSLGVAADF